MFSIFRLCLLFMLVFAMHGPVLACSEKELSAVIERAAENLRQENLRRQPALEKKFLELARRKGWQPEGAVERAYVLVQDDKIKALDAEAAELLTKLDSLGDAEGAAASCERLGKLKTAAARLLAVTKEKTRYVEAKLATMIASDGPSSPSPRKKASATPPQKAQTPAPRSPPPGAGTAGTSKWSTTTQPEAWPTQTVMSALPKLEQEAADTYTAEEISAAGRGLFGSLSAELAGVIEFTFRQYGQPNGYIVGNEGSAAFLAGLRFGSGRLATKRHGTTRVYWQGPSVGYDFGLTGSRVLILVYNLKEPDELFTRFAGLEGAAYLVGGAGITFHKRGRLVLAPIRTGLGVRVGANVGYLKFSRTRSLNPF